MENETAYWLLSTIVQTMGAMWAIFLGVFIIFREKINQWRLEITQIKKDESKDRYSHLFDITEAVSKIGGKLYIIILFLFNLFISLSVLFGILGFIFFRNDFLINLTILFSILGVILLMIYFSFIILLMYEEDIFWSD